jgi:hypothetical protein
MNQRTRRLLFWAPRVLSILFAIFVSLFALDVFSEGYGTLETLLALAIHLIPTIVIVMALIVAWRWEGLGAILFAALAVLYLGISSGGSWVISGPLFLIGLLFGLNWTFRKQRQRH